MHNIIRVLFVDQDMHLFPTKESTNSNTTIKVLNALDRYHIVVHHATVVAHGEGALLEDLHLEDENAEIENGHVTL